MTDPSELARQRWDAIVIGTGMGGATAGYALARAGLRVLFCDRGAHHSQPGRDALRGDYAESFMTGERDSPAAVLDRAGRWREPIDDLSYDTARSFVPFIGSGSGGSSALYGMALERFVAADFEPRAHHAHAPDCALPAAWPIALRELEPFYRQAEALFRVQPPRPLADADGASLTSANRELSDRFRARGLHPYTLPMASDETARCPGCQGFLCARDCKSHAGNRCLVPAIADHGAGLIEHFEATRLEADATRVVAVTGLVDGRPMRLEADRIVLAAGALATPALLLASDDDRWPTGLANRSGLVGRHLMRHCIDLYAVFTRMRPDARTSPKQIAFNDFYVTPGGKYGTVQSFGLLPPARMVVDEMQGELRDERGTAIAAAFGLAKPVLRPILHRLFARSSVLAAVMEDLPYAANRVSIVRAHRDAKPRIAIRYRLGADERARVARFRALVRGALSPYRFMLLDQVANNRRIAHACGTCRFGDDPASSVLDRNNRAWDVKNLYIVDASFFPSSGGTNPALTVAANALRVSEAIVAERARDAQGEGAFA